MKRLVPLGLSVIVLLTAIAFNSHSNANAQGAGVISSIVNRMERNRQTLKSLRASVSMVKYDSTLKDEDKRWGTVLYLPAAGRNAFVRVDWTKPSQETLAVANGEYVLYRPRLNMAYVGRAGSGRGKDSGALEFLSMSKAELLSRYEMIPLGAETLWGGVQTDHVKLVPKGAARFKYAEVWVDGNGMPVQSKIVERNDDATTVRLTNLERNAGISPDMFRLQLDSNVKKVKS